jgi:hypothetical protein
LELIAQEEGVDLARLKKAARDLAAEGMIVEEANGVYHV